MGKHTAVHHRARRRWFGRGRTRALLALGTVLSLGAVGTSAYWTDSATITTGTITSGTMDLQVAPTTSTASGTWGGVGLGTGYTAGHITIASLAPNESYAFNLAVRNVGSADFTYSGTVTEGASPQWGFAAGDITVRMYSGSADASDTTYPIQQSCGGGALTSAVSVTTGNTAVIPSRRLNATNSEQLCVLVSMLQAADNGDQGKTGQLRFDLAATQVTS